MHGQQLCGLNVTATYTTLAATLGPPHMTMPLTPMHVTDSLGYSCKSASAGQLLPAYMLLKWASAPLSCPVAHTMLVPRHSAVCVARPDSYPRSSQQSSRDNSNSITAGTRQGLGRAWGEILSQLRIGPPLVHAKKRAAEQRGYSKSPCCWFLAAEY